MSRQILVTIGDGRTSSAPPITRAAADTLGLRDTASPVLSRFRFSGDPGTGRMYLGQTSGTYSSEQFDKHIFPGATTSDPPTKRTKLSRVYNTPSKFVIDSGSKTKLLANAAAGRITIFTWKGISDGGASGPGGPYSLAQIVAGAADADIDANATFLAGLGMPVWWGFFHEPEQLNSTINTTLMDNYRAAYRRQITRIRAIAPNVAFFSPFFASQGSWYSGRGTLRDLRWFHPNYTGDPRTQGSPGGGHWLSDGPFSGSWVNGDGLDIYNPVVGSNITPTSHNVLFMGKFQDFLDTRTVDGWYNLPVACGEAGFYNQVSTLTATGITNSAQFADLFTNGVAAGVVGAVLWNNSLATYDSTEDLYPTLGAKSAALEAQVNAHLTTVVMG